MNIVIVTRNMNAGGVERVIAQLVKEWSVMNVNCSLICMHPQKMFYTLPSNINIYDIPEFSECHYIDKVLKYIHLRKIIKKMLPDIILALPEEIGIYVLLAMMGTKIPVVVSERNNPWIMPYKKITRLLRSLLYPMAEGLIFQTQYAASFFSEKQQKKGIILQNPLDLSRIPEPYKGIREKVIVGAGRLETQKNFKLLIEAFSEFYKNHKDYKLVIYGEGSLRNELELYAKEKNSSNVVIFGGNVLDLPDRINSCAAFVLSSNYEGMPNVLIESLAMGVPCIATDCPSGGPKELIKNGENGFLINVGDTEALITCMEKVVSEVLIISDVSEIKERFNSEVVSRQWLDYLKEVLDRR